MTDSTEKKSLIEFPCTFPVKVMGVVHPEFESAILETVRKHAPDTEPHHITTRPSSKGNYTGATVKVNVESKEQLWCCNENRAQRLGRLPADFRSHEGI